MFSVNEYTEGAPAQQYVSGKDKDWVAASYVEWTTLRVYISASIKTMLIE